MARGANLDGVTRVRLAARLLQLHSVEQAAAGVALVAAGVVVAALGAAALDEAVGQEAVAAEAKHLLRVLLHDQAVGVQLAENILGNDLLARKGRDAVSASGTISVDGT